MNGNGKIRIAFAGDLCMGGEYASLKRRGGGVSLDPFGGIGKVLDSSDLFVVNLEGPISDGGNLRTRVTSILANETDVLDFLGSRNTAACLSNNHIMDHGPEGLEETIHRLDAAGIPHFGAGSDMACTLRPTYVQVRDVRIGLLGFSSDEPYVGSVTAGPGTAGTAPCRSESLPAVLKLVSAARSKCDALIVSMHWGIEYFNYPLPGDVDIAMALVDSGASVVFGHHPHTCQGMIRHGNGLVLFSLGNLFLPAVASTTGRVQPRVRPAREFMIAVVELSREGVVDWETYGGIMARDFSLRAYRGTGMEDFRRKVDMLSEGLMDPGYGEFWNRYAEKRKGQLKRMYLVQAVRKLLTNSPINTIRTLRWEDVARNANRLFR